MFSCQYLSSEFNRCLPEVFPNVFCRICLKGSLDVSLDQPNIFLACVCLMGLIGVCLSWFSPFLFCQCLSGGTCWCLSGLNPSVSLTSVCLVGSIGVCLKCFPMLFCQYLSNGTTWCLSGFFWKAHLVSVWFTAQWFWKSCFFRWSFSASACLISSLCICLNWYPRSLDQTLRLSSVFVCLWVQSVFEGITWMSFLEPFQDSVSRSIRSPSDLLTQSFYQDCASSAACK